MSRKKSWFLKLARPYVRRRLRASFDGMRVAGLASVRDQLAQGPVILAPNHVAWWDAFVCVALEEALDAQGHCVMDAENLRSLPFFAWLGAVPLDRSHPKLGLQNLYEAAAELVRPGDLLILFPQGHQRPAHLPLQFQRGIEVVARKTGLPVIPVALRYDYLESARPRIHVSCGPAQVWSSRSFLQNLESAVQRELARIDSEILSTIGAPGNRAAEATLGERRVARTRTPTLSQNTEFSDLFVGQMSRLPLGGSILARFARGTTS